MSPCGLTPRLRSTRARGGTGRSTLTPGALQRVYPRAGGNRPVSSSPMAIMVGLPARAGEPGGRESPGACFNRSTRARGNRACYRLAQWPGVGLPARGGTGSPSTAARSFTRTAGTY